MLSLKVNITVAGLGSSINMLLYLTNFNRVEINNDKRFKD